MDRIRKILILSAIAGLVINASGCVYLRLLTLKNQLKRHEKYITYDKKDGLEITFKEPPLLASDMKYLIATNPTRESALEKGFKWVWIFEKENKGGVIVENGYKLEFESKIIDNRIKTFKISERLCAIIPKEFVIMVIESMGKAKINRKEKSAGIKENISWDGVKLLTREQVFELLGNPYSQKTEDEFIEYTYKFRLKDDEKKLEDRKKAGAVFGYNKKSQEIEYIECYISGFKLKFDFIRNKRGE